MKPPTRKAALFPFLCEQPQFRRTAATPHFGSVANEPYLFSAILNSLPCKYHIHGVITHRTHCFVRTDKAATDFEARRDHEAPEHLTQLTHAELSELELARSSSCQSTEQHSHPNSPNSIPTAMRRSPQVVCTQYSFGGSKARLHWNTSNPGPVPRTFSRINTCCISTGYLRRQERKCHPDRGFIPPNLFFFENLTNTSGLSLQPL